MSVLHEELPLSDSELANTLVSNNPSAPLGSPLSPSFIMLVRTARSLKPYQHATLPSRALPSSSRLPVPPQKLNAAQRHGSSATLAMKPANRNISASSKGTSVTMLIAPESSYDGLSCRISIYALRAARQAGYITHRSTPGVNYRHTTGSP
jgi:hypothetical protein